MFRYILITVDTCTTPRDAEDYELQAQKAFETLTRLMGDLEAPYFKRVDAVESVEVESSFEHDGSKGTIVCNVLVCLRGERTPDIAKPAFEREAAKQGFKVQCKKVVPARAQPEPPEGASDELFSVSPAEGQ